MYFAVRPLIFFFVAKGWKTPHSYRAHFLNSASLYQKALDKLDHDIFTAKVAIDLQLVMRRALMEKYAKDFTPLESFDMRLDQLLLEYPQWTSYGRDDRDDGKSSYNVHIEDVGCKAIEGIILDRLKDPRYILSVRIAEYRVDCFDKTDRKSVV